MNFNKWFIKYAGKVRTTGHHSNGHVTVHAVSANHAITLAMVEIPRELGTVQITTVHKLE